MTSLEIHVAEEEHNDILCQLNTLKSLYINFNIKNGNITNISKLQNLETFQVTFYRKPSDWITFFEIIKRTKNLKELRLREVVFDRIFSEQLVECTNIENLLIFGANGCEKTNNAWMLIVLPYLKENLKTFKWRISKLEFETKLLKLDKIFQTPTISIKDLQYHFKKEMPKVKLLLFK